MTTVLPAVLLLASAGPPAEAQLSQNARALRDFVVQTYLKKQLKRDREMAQHGQKSNPRTVAQDLILDHWLSPYRDTGHDSDFYKPRYEFPQYPRLLYAAGTTLARLYGYAVENQRLKDKQGSMEAKLLRAMEAEIIPELLRDIAASMHQVKPDGPSEEELLKKLLLEFNLALRGDYELEMRKLTGVSFLQAPSMFPGILASMGGRTPSRKRQPEAKGEPERQPESEPVRYRVTITGERDRALEARERWDSYRVLEYRDGPNVTLHLLHTTVYSRLPHPKIGGKVSRGFKVHAGKSWLINGLGTWERCEQRAKDLKQKYEKEEFKPPAPGSPGR